MALLGSAHLIFLGGPRRIGKKVCIRYFIEKKKFVFDQQFITICASFLKKIVYNMVIFEKKMCFSKKPEIKVCFMGNLLPPAH